LLVFAIVNSTKTVLLRIEIIAFNVKKCKQIQLRLAWLWGTI